MPTTIAIPKTFTHGDELILVHRREFEALKKQIAEFKYALKVIRQGEKEYRQGKIKPVQSVSELMK